MRHIREFYKRPSTMTSAGVFEPLLDSLPGDVAALVRTVQGLLVHEHLASAYGVVLTDEDRTEPHIRPVERVLGRIIEKDGGPLTAVRPAESRFVGVCRHFAVLLTAMLRSQAVPARARCGFGGYFISGKYEDHWVCEYWNDVERRWVLVDAQVDELQREMFRPDFDLCDVPRDRFVVAGDAWAQCRAGKADPDSFGLSFVPESGLWFIAQNMLRDVAALNNMEMLPWDDWGAMPRPDEPLTQDQLEFFDHLAALTQVPDVSFGEIRSLYESDDRLRVGEVVRNAALGRDEPVYTSHQAPV